MSNVKNIVIMNDNTLSISLLGDRFGKKHNVTKLKISANDINNIPSGIIPDLFIINFGNNLKADILYICDSLNSRPFDHIPIIYSGDYFSHTIFSSKLNITQRAAVYVASGNIEELQKYIIRELNVSRTIEDNSDVKKRILLIDDDPLILSAVANYLANDYIVSAVDSAAKAFMNIGKHKPSLILLDYMMPLCDGKQTLIMLKNLHETEEIPVIMLTSHTEKERVLECHSLGAIGYLVKPVNRNALISTIMKSL